MKPTWSEGTDDGRAAYHARLRAIGLDPDGPTSTWRPFNTWTVELLIRMALACPPEKWATRKVTFTEDNIAWNGPNEDGSGG